jgi:hypothetical protein
MRNFLLPLVASIVIFMTGCIHLPSTSLYSPANPTPVGPAIPGVANLGHPTGPAAPANASPAKRAIQTTFNWLATLSVIGGLACLALAGLSFYRACIVSGVKFVIAGIMLPVSGIFVAYHWLLIVGLILAALASYLLWRGRKYAEPVLKNVEANAADVVNKIVPPASKPAEANPAPPAK